MENFTVLSINYVRLPLQDLAGEITKDYHVLNTSLGFAKHVPYMISTFTLTIPYKVGMMTNSNLQVRNTGAEDFSTTGLVRCQAGI